MARKTETKLIPSSTVFAEFSSREDKQFINARAKYYETLENIYRSRKALDLTQQELAEKSGVPRETISKIENGKRNATIGTLMALAKAMGKKLEIRLS